SGDPDRIELARRRLQRGLEGGVEIARPFGAAEDADRVRIDGLQVVEIAADAVPPAGDVVARERRGRRVVAAVHEERGAVLGGVGVHGAEGAGEGERGRVFGEARAAGREAECGFAGGRGGGSAGGEEGAAAGARRGHGGHRVQLRTG